MRIHLLLPALSAAAALSAARPAPAPRCSLAPFTSARDPAATYFVGRARPETVHVGPGAVRYELAPGHWGRPTGGPISGQVVRVEALGGSGAARMEAAFARAGDRDVIVVPWDYDAGCETVPWARSARWVETGEPGFYTVRLRAESLWFGGRPVLDAFAADLEPYPHGLFFQRGSRGTDALRRVPSLTADEFFAFYAALPDQELEQRDRAAARAVLEAWARAHPELAAKYPASALLRRRRPD